MNQESEKQRLEEAKTCKDCPGWLKHCNAECCRILQFTLQGRSKRKIRIGEKIEYGFMGSPDMIEYYEMHGIMYDQRKKALIIKPIQFLYMEPNLFIMRTCNNLTKDGKCVLHGTDKKPPICAKLNEETVGKIHNAIVTMNCLFRYKQILKKQEKEKESDKE